MGREIGFVMAAILSVCVVAGARDAHAQTPPAAQFHSVFNGDEQADSQEAKDFAKLVEWYKKWKRAKQLDDNHPLGYPTKWSKDAEGRRDQSAWQGGSYHVYFSLKSIPLAGKTNVFAYDLQHQSEDVCIRLGGGDMLGDSFVSNVFVVPKDAITDAISRAGLR
jgi:hypothetical protein